MRPVFRIYQQTVPVEYIVLVDYTVPVVRTDSAKRTGSAENIAPQDCIVPAYKEMPEDLQCCHNYILHMMEPVVRRKADKDLPVGQSSSLCILVRYTFPDFVSLQDEF